MKKSWLFGLAVCMLVFGLVFSGCKSGDDNNSGSAQLNFSNEQVYEVVGVEELGQYTGSATVTSNQGVSGSITNGKLSFTIGVPAYLSSLEDAGGLDIPPGTSVNPSNVLIANLELRLDNGAYLVKTDGAMTATSYTQEDIEYMYVNMNCTVTIPAMPEQGLSATTLQFKEGWNALNTIITVSDEGFTGALKIVNLSYGRWVIDNRVN